MSPRRRHANFFQFEPFEPRGRILGLREDGFSFPQTAGRIERSVASVVVSSESCQI
jgi:hypothetical protein